MAVRVVFKKRSRAGIEASSDLVAAGDAQGNVQQWKNSSDPNKFILDAIVSGVN